MRALTAMPTPSPSTPHPLTQRLIARLQASLREPEAQVHVLEIGPGSGRTTIALQNAGIETTTLPDVIPNGASLDAQLRDCHAKFSAVLTTHSFLHGLSSEIATLVERVAQSLEPRGLLYATFGSKRDA